MPSLPGVKVLITLGLLLGAAPRTFAAIVGYSGGTYADNLDGLGTASTWSNDSTLAGWYAYETSLGVILPNRADDSWGVISDANHNDFHRSTGQQTFGLLNFGTSNASGNRSLGSYNDAPDFVFALVLRNDSTATFTDFTLSYFGEQWQINAPSGHPSMKLDFTYGVFASFNAASAIPIRLFRTMPATQINPVALIPAILTLRTARWTLQRFDSLALARLWTATRPRTAR